MFINSAAAIGLPFTLFKTGAATAIGLMGGFFQPILFKNLADFRTHCGLPASLPAVRSLVAQNPQSKWLIGNRGKNKPGVPTLPNRSKITAGFRDAG